MSLTPLLVVVVALGPAGKGANTTRTAEPIHLAWTDDPATTLSVVWRTLDPRTPSELEFRVAGEASWTPARGAIRPSGASGALHEVSLTGLASATPYEYRVRSAPNAWSRVRRARTAPAAGPADFSAVFVADTGIAGRLDGLATGTRQVVGRVAALQPLFVLLGGDYAYLNTDGRFASQDEAMDAWFAQMQPISEQAPLMPTYGNHEVLLQESVRGWLERFPTPSGFEDRRSYSFDVGEVHFVSILAVDDHRELPRDRMAWIEADLAAARAAGARWIVPFLHVSPFGDGTNHPSNEALRRQLGPVLESHGVELVLTAQDQAYERTFPLRDIGGADLPTSTSRRCYTPSDGVTFAKISPGGKLSNLNRSFSTFRSNPAPAWTAVRDNALHVYGHLTASASGALQLDVLGVPEDGATPLLVDSFRYVEGGCPPELQFGVTGLSYDLGPGESADTTISLRASDDSAIVYALSAGPRWLDVSPRSGSTGDEIQVRVDATGLSAGSYAATVVASAAGGEALSGLLAVRLRVARVEIRVSPRPTRAASQPLRDSTQSGLIYVFSKPDEGIDRMHFSIDDAFERTEKKAPFDLGGTDDDPAQMALPFDTKELAEGAHTLTARADFLGWSAVAHAPFTVDNVDPQLFPSMDELPLDAGSRDGRIGAVELHSGTGEASAFTLTSDASWLTARSDDPVTPATLTVTADPTGLEPGEYVGTIAARADGHPAAHLTVRLTVPRDRQASSPLE